MIIHVKISENKNHDVEDNTILRNNIVFISV